MVAMVEEVFSVNQGHMDGVSTKEELTLTSRVGQFLSQQGGLAKERMSTLVELLVDPESHEQRTQQKVRFEKNDDIKEAHDDVEASPRHRPRRRMSKSTCVSEKSESAYYADGLLGTVDKYHQCMDKPLKTIASMLDQAFERLAYAVWGIQPSLSEATYRGDVWLMREIMTGDNINEKEDELSNLTPLHLAARAGHVQAVELLLQHPRVQINAKDAWNGTPFHAACAEGHLDIVRALLEVSTPGNEVELNALNNFAQTPLDLAHKHRKADIATLLSRLGGVDGETQIQELNEKARKRRAEERSARMQREVREAGNTWMDNAWMAVEQVMEENFHNDFD